MLIRFVLFISIYLTLYTQDTVKVASVLGTDIYLNDPNFVMPQRITSFVTKKGINSESNRRVKKLWNKLLVQLLKDYEQQHNINATEKEIVSLFSY